MNDPKKTLKIVAVAIIWAILLVLILGVAPNLVWAIDGKDVPYGEAAAIGTLMLLGFACIILFLVFLTKMFYQFVSKVIDQKE